jgi:cation transporter-like permease
MRFEDLEHTLGQQPIWEPPLGFAPRVVERVRSENLPPPPESYLAASIVRGIGQGTLVGATAYVLGRFAWLATPALVEHAMLVAWTCALLSLAVATSLTRRALRP